MICISNVYCRCFVHAPTSKFIVMRVRLGWCAKGHKIYTGSGRMSLRPVCCCSCYQHRERSIVRGTNDRERDWSQVSDGRVERRSRAWQQLDCVCVSCVVQSKVRPLDGRSASPFIDEGAGFTRMRALPNLVAHVYPAQFFILMSAKEDKCLQYCRCLCRMSG